MTYIGSRLSVFWPSADFFIQRWRFEKSIKQTKAEVKEDMKAMEGNPAVKGKIRSIQRETGAPPHDGAREGCGRDRHKSDTLRRGARIQAGKMAAPRVMAKGRDWLAQRIKELGREYDIPTVENVPLARALYRSVEVEQEIPVELYKAVAEVLAFVFKVVSVCNAGESASEAEFVRSDIGMRRTCSPIGRRLHFRAWHSSALRMTKAQLAMPIAIVIILMAVIIPLPTIVLDILISANIALSVVILLSAVYLLESRPVFLVPFDSPDDDAVPAFAEHRLDASDPAATASEGLAAAGEVIRAFGQFVVGGNYAVGIVIFLVLIVIQYVVINHGAVRISEVTARFTLDALPGKQLSIDADLNAGIIDQHEARERRAEIGKEAEFYGSMDGAIRFTQRDAMASILITLINIVGGLFIGVFQYGCRS